MSIRTEAARLLAGEKTFEQFYRATRVEWRREAQRLLRMWRLPAAVELEDVEQELVSAAWQVLGQFDASRGVELGAWLNWNAHASTKRWLHRQRKALRLSGKSESRHAVSLSEMARKDQDGQTVEVQLLDVTNDSAEDALAVVDAIREAVGWLDKADRFCLVALVAAGGNVRAAAETLFRNREFARQLRIDSVDDAAERVARVASRTATAAAAVA